MERKALEDHVKMLEERYRELKLLLMSRLKLLHTMLKEDLIEGFKREAGYEWGVYSERQSLEIQIRDLIGTYDELKRIKAELESMKRRLEEGVEDTNV